MHCFLYVRLDGFYSAIEEARQDGAQASSSTLKICPNDGSPESQSPAIVVHRDRTVVCASQAAREHGIEPGMPFAEAKAILRNGLFIAFDEERYRPYQEAWLDACCQFSDVIEPADQHEAYIDLSSHPDPAAMALKLAHEVGGRAGGLPCVVIGIASTKWIAKAAAGVIPNSALQTPSSLREPVLDPAGFIAGMPVDMLLPASPEHRRRLRFLGYRTIGDVAKLSLATLKGQFGTDGLRIYQAAWGGCFESVEAVYPRNAIQERFAFDEAVESEEVFERGLEELAKRLSKKLREKDLEGSHLKVWIEHEEASTTMMERTFTKPMQTWRSILAGLKAVSFPSLLVADGSCRGVEQVRVQMPNLTKAKRRQTDLYGALAEKAAGNATALSQVRQVFGDYAVRLASEVVEPRRKRLLKVWKDATGWR